MSICNNCRYKVNDNIWCLLFNHENWHLWVNHMQELKQNGSTKCDLFKAPANIQQKVQADSQANSLT